MFALRNARKPGCAARQMKGKRIFSKIFSKKCHTAVDGSESGAYNAAHRTRAAALLAADELALGFPDGAGEN